MKGHFYKPHCKCTTKKCKCSATWSYIIDVGINPATGKRKQKKKGGFPTKAEAELHAANLLVELKQGTYVEEKDITFSEFSETWIKIYSGSGKVKVSTIRLRTVEIKRLFKHLQFYKMKDITRNIYQEMLNTMKTEYNHNTLVGTHRTAKMIFKKAVEMNVIKKDPTEFSYIPKEQKTVEDLEATEKRVKYLEKEDLQLFLDTAELKGHERDYEIFKTLAYTGMRVGELCALKRPDIDVVNNEISITKTLFNPSNTITDYTLLTPKTVTSRRTITVDPEVISILVALMKRQNETKMRFRDTYHDKDFVFAKNARRYPGYPETPQLINWRMSRLLKICGLDESLTPHSLRHTHTSLLAEAGAELHEIMDRLGHKDDSTTESVYLHVTKSRKKDTSSKFSALMKSIK